MQETINSQSDFSFFPYEALNKRLNIETTFNDTEIENLLGTNYSTKYSYLILSLLYPDRDWKDKKFHEDHIFPKSEFTTAKLKLRGYNEDKMKEYQKHFNSIANLQLLTDSENLEKSNKDFETWFSTRDSNFKDRNAIPTINTYNFDNFLEFISERRALLTPKLKSLTI